MFSKVAKALGFPDFVIAQLHWYFREYQKNAFGQGAPTSSVIDVTEQPPEDFETIVRRYITTSPYAILFIDAVHPTMATQISCGWITCALEGKKGVGKAIATTASRTRVNTCALWVLSAPLNSTP
jgi:hypothetical protein